MVTPPERIVSLVSSATEILFAIGAGPRVVGVGHECDWPPEARKRPCVTRSFIDAASDSSAIDSQVRERLAAGLPLYEVDREQVARLAPQLIVTQAQCDVCAIRYDDVCALVASAQSLRGARVLALQPTSLAEILADVRRIGEACGALDQANRFVAGLQQRIERVRQSVMARPRVRAACIEWIEPLMLAANWTPELIEIAGGEAGLVRGGEHSTYASWDDLRRYDPEVLLISPCGFDLRRSLVEAQRLTAMPGWTALAAVHAGNVFVIDGNAYLNRSGPRIVDSLEIVAHALHPEAFPEVDHPGWQRGLGG